MSITLDYLENYEELSVKDEVAKEMLKYLKKDKI